MALTDKTNSDITNITWHYVVTESIALETTTRYAVVGQRSFGTSVKGVVCDKVLTELPSNRDSQET